MADILFSLALALLVLLSNPAILFSINGMLPEWINKMTLQIVAYFMSAAFILEQFAYRTHPDLYK